MNIYVIAYDRPLGLLRNDAEFQDVIRALGPRYIRPMDRLWLVGTDLTPEEMGQRLLPYLQGQGDRLFITQLQNYYGLLPPETWTWIESVAREYLPYRYR